MLLLLKRFGAPVTANATAILYQQHPTVAVSNDILCASILVLCLLDAEWRSCHVLASKAGADAMKAAAGSFPPLAWIHSLAPGLFKAASVRKHHTMQ